MSIIHRPTGDASSPPPDVGSNGPSLNILGNRVAPQQGSNLNGLMQNLGDLKEKSELLIYLIEHKSLTILIAQIYPIIRKYTLHHRRRDRELPRPRRQLA